MAAEGPRMLVLEIAGIGLEIRPSDPDIQMVAGPDHTPFLTDAVRDDCARIVLAPSTDRIARRRPGKGASNAG